MIIDILKRPKITSVKIFLLWIAIGNLMSGLCSQFEDSIAYDAFSCMYSMLGEDLGQEISILSSTALGIFAYKSVADLDPETNSSYATKSIIVTILLSIIMVVLPIFPFSLYTYGYADHCVILTNPDYSQAATVKGIFIILILQCLPFLIITIISYAKLMLLLRKNFRASLKKLAPFNMNSLFWYPSAQFVLYFPAVFWWIQMVISGDSEVVKALSRVADIMMSSAGFVCALLYVKFPKNSDNEDHNNSIALDLSTSLRKDSFISSLKLERAVSEFGLPIS